MSKVYTFLTYGETIQAFDEVYMAGEWLKVARSSIGKPHNSPAPVRRSVNSPDNVEHDTYIFLTYNDSDVIEPGDLIQDSPGVWIPISSVYFGEMYKDIFMWKDFQIMRKVTSHV